MGPVIPRSSGKALAWRAGRAYAARFEIAETMPLNRRQFLATASSAALAPTASVLAAQGPAAANAASDAVLAEMAEALLVEYPENATFLGLDRGPRASLKHRLTDRSIAADQARARSCTARLERLRRTDRKALSGMSAINYDCALWAHEAAAEGYRFKGGDNAVLNTLQAESISPYVVSQGTGDFAVVPDLLHSQHAVATADDAEAWLARMSALAKALDAENERMRRDQANGVIAPGFLLDTTLGEQTGYRAKPAAQWGLVTSLADKAKAARLAGDWAGRARRIAQTEVAPALERQIATLKALRAKASHDAGVWRLPDGEAWYAWFLKVGTTTPLSPAQVHAMGLEQTRALSSQMDALLKAQGLTRGTVGERLLALSRDPKFLFPDTDAGRARLLAYLNGRVAAVRARLPQAFATLPKAELVIKRVPPEIEAGAPDGYEQDGPIDGSRPASYYINLRDTGNWPRYSLPTLTFHEGLPGHVWQGVFAHRLTTIRSMLEFNAYVEGWALYAEQLGDELGLYADDPFGKIGYLQSIQFRACRLAVDTGLHAMRWSREQAIDWFVANNGSPRDQIRSEVDRYCAWPGQACGYKIGHSWINRLRDKARAALGPRFDLKTFDDALVKSGAVPLTVLDRVVDDYIASRKA
jgi:uncharacterized protein (DUF885 family)